MMCIVREVIQNLTIQTFQVSPEVLAKELAADRQQSISKITHCVVGGCWTIFSPIVYFSAMTER